MLLLSWPIILFLLVAYRFRKRFQAEVRRQQAITWPAVPASFGVDVLDLAAAEPVRGNAAYRSTLAADYQFYTLGKRYAGNEILPEQLTLDKEARTTLLQRLNACKNTLQVRYDPADPARSFLAVGHGRLNWTKVIGYAVLGVILPLFLTYSALALLTDPEVWWDAVTFGTMENTQTS